MDAERVGYRNVTVRQGKLFRKRYRVKIDGVAITDSDWTALFQVRKNAASAEAILEASVGDGVTYDAGTDFFTVEFDTEAMAAITPGQYVYECEFYDGDGEAQYAVAGDFHVQAEVARVDA